MDRETGNRIRKLFLCCAKVGKEFQQIYLDNEMASTVIGFSQADNQETVGPEALGKGSRAFRGGKKIETLSGKALDVSLHYTV